ncbi:MAG: YebC/PmpR family DNA-binding transcriptional regulator [Candidatus Liptonbacteria bacterium]|nr:YebC/PmpR family DNA-binding transcriptional regulator [Candidatus Liptonbacteria bacterium]
MSGHSHWSGIKHKKEITDKKRGKVFSKLLKAVTAAARTEPNPDFNPRLRTTIQKAKELSVPLDNIGRAIKKASEPGAVIEELLMESYGPCGSALLIEALTDSKNRTISEVKKILSVHGAKWAEPGSVRWAFSQSADLRGLDADSRRNWVPKFPQDISKEDGDRLSVLIEALEEHEDVQEIYTNAN